MQNSSKSLETLKVSGDIPLPRFGHTITLISKTKAILFGGATGDTGKYSITGDAYVFDCTPQKWKKLEPNGSSPSQRAAHASTSVELNQMVVYGGATGGGGLAPDDLYLLDLRSGEENAQWIIVPVVGTTPGRRYGHTIAFSKPFLVVMGGNTGSESANDVWLLNVEKAPLFWTKLECEGDVPPVRVYHSAALCKTGTATGMIVIFGGRTSDQSALNDTWGLRRHRNDTWDWVRAPYKAGTEPPVGRYQHSTLFIGSTMLVVGGRTNNVGETVPLEAYDCESSNWLKLPSVPRFRHACWVVDDMLYVHGGFEQELPNVPTDTVARLDISRILGLPSEPTISSLMTSSASNLNMNASGHVAIGGGGGRSQPNESIRDNSNLVRPPGRTANTAIFTKTNTVRISDTVIAVMQDDKDRTLQNIALDQLSEESKKLRQGYNYKEVALGSSNSKSLYLESIYSPFIAGLLKPSKDPMPLNENKFMFKKEQIIKLIDESINLFENSNDRSTVLSLKIPIKIFGSLHGQYGDLMRLFNHWGAPTNNGDIEGFDYLFLGNYVDRGKFSLETVCILFALKLKYPDQLHLLRGSHEDVKINRVFGFGEECATRLGEDINDPKSVFQRFNKLFEHLPLAAVVQDKILCVHSGIGSSVRSVQDIEAISRPVEVAHDSVRRDQQVVVDLLWSDPVQGDDDSGTSQSTSAYSVKNTAKFNMDRLKSFLVENGLTMMIRSHECVIDGFERMWNGTLLTVFSATDYCGKHTNAAAVVVIKKNSEVTPKIIYPLSSSDDEKVNRYGNKALGGYGASSMMGAGGISWIDNEESFKKRPATPPRYGGRAGMKKMA